MTELPVLVFEVPLPPTALSPNHRGETVAARQARSKRLEQYRTLVRFAARDAAIRAGWKPPIKARISLLYAIRPTPNTARDELDRLYRPRDWDNAVAAFKAGQDGIVAAGVLKGDTWGMLEGGRISATGAEGPFVRVTIETLESEVMATPGLFDD